MNMNLLMDRLIVSGIVADTGQSGELVWRGDELARPLGCILSSRPLGLTPSRAGPVKAGRGFRGHPKGLALIGPSTAASSIGSGR